MTGRSAQLALLVAALSVVDASATRYRRPYHPAIALGYGFDNNFGAGGCLDWGCGGKCYDGHTGSDFPLGMGTDVLAGAPGTVVAAFNGCDNWGYYGNPCGGKCGNHVRIQHADGSRTVYCHMQNGSIAVSVGQQVSCGQLIGRSASSGSSTGPHLHFGWAPSGVSRDPFSGGCAAGGGWVDQGGYPGLPSTSCEVNCQCPPGASESTGCGNCGTRTRFCGGDCQWGGWSGCQGEGVCAPGTVQSEACCTCGSRTRACTGGCQWPEWSACAGPDPAGPPGCDTGLLGDCGGGAVLCVSGCLACTQTVFPSPELCDDRDSDCDGATDEEASEVGVPPARYAAELVDLSAPEALASGEDAEVWARFQNVGHAPWPPGRAWLQGVELGGAASPLRTDDWSAFDAAVVVDQWVAPGETVTLAFPVQMPAAPSPGTRFTLLFDGAAIRCPSPGFDVAPRQLAPSPVAAVVPRTKPPEEPPEEPEEARRDPVAVTDEDPNVAAPPDIDGPSPTGGTSGCGVSGATDRWGVCAAAAALALGLRALRRRLAKGARARLPPR